MDCPPALSAQMYTAPPLLHLRAHFSQWCPFLIILEHLRNSLQREAWIKMDLLDRLSVKDKLGFEQGTFRLTMLAFLVMSLRAEEWRAKWAVGTSSGCTHKWPHWLSLLWTGYKCSRLFPCLFVIRLWPWLVHDSVWDSHFLHDSLNLLLMASGTFLAMLPTSILHVWLCLVCPWPCVSEQEKKMMPKDPNFIKITPKNNKIQS